MVIKNKLGFTVDTRSTIAGILVLVLILCSACEYREPLITQHDGKSQYDRDFLDCQREADNAAVGDAIAGVILTVLLIAMLVAASQGHGGGGDFPYVGGSSSKEHLEKCMQNRGYMGYRIPTN